MADKESERVYSDLWARRSAGFLIPLFSVRTEKSLGIGDIGDLYQLIDWAAEHGQSIIQLLPINDTRPGDASPYAAISTFASNPLYINIERVEEVQRSASAKRLLREWDADGTIDLLRGNSHVDYEAVRAVKMGLLAEGFNVFLKEEWEKDSEKADEFLIYAEDEKEWLLDYAIFRLLKEEFRNSDWRSWPDEIRKRDNLHLAKLEKKNYDRFLFHQWLQWEFDKQWKEMRRYAHGKGVFLMGDVSFYPGVDSVEVWANPHCFQLNKDFSLSASAGAPPDYFNPDGQNWGMPLYDWERMEADDFAWWVKRVKRVCDFFDLYRLDHFRGFESYWQVPEGKVASEGEWIEAPGEKLLQRLLKVSLYEKLFIPLAEDLGDISPEVHELRRKLGIAGYKTFIFGWGEGEESGKASGYRYPEDYAPDFVATTGTHDTPTLSHWWEALRDDEKSALLAYLGLERDVHFGKVREAVLAKLFHSKALFVVLPFQDILGLGPEHRVNVPGTFGDHNWSWRMPFSVEELKSATENSIAGASRFLDEVTLQSGRDYRRKAPEGSLAILPVPGSLQERIKGEKFEIWIAVAVEPKEITFRSALMDNDEAPSLVVKLPDGMVIYRGTVDASEAGTYSLHVNLDGEETVAEGCLRVI